MSATRPNGTFPTVRSNETFGNGDVSNPSARIDACGYSRRAIDAVIGSSSTPVQSTGTSVGASPMNDPAPHPGSNTRPPVNPAARTAAHMARMTSGSV